MDNFNVTLNIEDLICSKCCRDREQRSIQITSSSQTINLKESYILNVVAVSTRYITVLIQNGIETIIRNVYISYPVQICLPCKCANHVLTISGEISNT